MTDIVLAVDDDGTVRIAPAVVAAIAPLLREGARKVQQGGLTLTPLQAATVSAFSAGQDQVRLRAQAGSPQLGGDVSESERQQGDRLRVRDVARDVGVSPQAVRAAAAGGRLTGRRLDGEWWFDPEDVRTWRDQRRTDGRDGNDD